MSLSDAVSIVLVDSKASDQERIKKTIESKGWSLRIFSNGKEALEFILENPVSALLTEYRLEGIGGLQLIEVLNQQKPILPVIMTSGASDSSVAIKAVQAGAYDYLPKPVDGKELIEVIEEALAGAKQMSEKVTLTDQLTEEDTGPVLIGKSRAMAKVYRDLAKLAATPVTVLIRGETGTGKELVARALYQHGHRAHKPFIAVNCAAIPENLLESELFGHEKGSFTGATNTRIGRFEQANGATLFLDEIGDMQPLLQAKMLRVLQEKVIQRVGGKEEIPVDVRIIAATHRNLEVMVDQGEFRADLFYRLNASTIKLPPLRDRLGDVALLTKHFLSRFGKELEIEDPVITKKALSLLERQPWNGNIRQLQNLIRSAILKRRNLAISPEDVSELLSEEKEHSSHESSKNLRELAEIVLNQAEQGEVAGAYREMLRHMEEALFYVALKKSNGNQAQASRWLGITRYTLREKLKHINTK